jgi:hypothetical protein
LRMPFRYWAEWHKGWSGRDDADLSHEQIQTAVAAAVTVKVTD